MATIFSYVGAFPADANGNGQPAPNLATVPVPPSGDPNNRLVFVLAFANADSSGKYIPG